MAGNASTTAPVDLDHVEAQLLQICQRRRASAEVVQADQAAEFAQHLLAHGCYAVEFGCSSDEFTHLSLFFGGQRGAPDRLRH